MSEEGTDIRKILESQAKEAKNALEAQKEIQEALIESAGTNDSKIKNIRKNLQDKLKQLKKGQNGTILSGGDYAKSAIMYYNAAQATMYALNENSTMTDIFRALPKTEREYYMEWVREKDLDKRKEIMKYTSPSLRKALKLAWTGEVEKPESNESYFSSHTLPAPTWSGWNPGIDLDDVQAKVIANEASLNPSDFGIYASQYRDSNVINAPNIEYHDGGDGIILSALKVKSILNGYGLYGVDVNVKPKKDSSLDVMCNVATIAAYKIDTALFG